MSGLLLNELTCSGAQLLAQMQKLVTLALSFDTFHPGDIMSDVIFYVTRLAVRVEAGASLLIDQTFAQVGARSHPFIDFAVEAPK